MKMKSDVVSVFESSEFGKVRTVVIDDEPWLVGKDVAVALGYERDTKAVQDHVDDDDKYLIDGKTQSQFGIELGQRGGWLINESGMYALVFSSKLPKAKEFKHWVTHEVLPSIRKHGGYLTPEKVEEVLSDPDTIIRLATQLKEEREKRKLAEHKIEQDKPLVNFASHVSNVSNSIPIGDFAKIVSKNNINIGRNKLFKWLRDAGMFMNGNVPYQKSIDTGYFTVKEGTYSTPYGEQAYTKTLITGKGQIYILEKLRAEYGDASPLDK